MRKREELSNPNSCLNRAADDEMLFVLRGSDVAAPDTVRAWCRSRIEAGKNTKRDSQILEALAWAEAVEEQQKRRTITIGINVTYKSIDAARQQADTMLRQLESGGPVFAQLSVEDATAVAVALREAAWRDEKAEQERAAAVQQQEPPAPAEVKAVMHAAASSRNVVLKDGTPLEPNAGKQAKGSTGVVAVMTGLEGRIALFDETGRPLELAKVEAIARAINGGKVVERK